MRTVTSESATFIYTSDEEPLRFTHALFCVPIAEVADRSLELLRAELRRQDDRRFQAVQNNLWDNNPGELERWADDGGRNV